MKSIVIFGASRGVGRCLTEQALSQGYRVTAAVRNPATASIAHERLRTIFCDVLNPDAVERADVADFMLRQATSDEYLYKVPAIAY